MGARRDLSSIGWWRFVWILAAVEVLALLYFGHWAAGLAQASDLVLQARWSSRSTAELWSAVRWVNVIAALALWLASPRAGSRRRRERESWPLVGWVGLLLTLSLATKALQRTEPALRIDRVIDCRVDPCRELTATEAHGDGEVRNGGGFEEDLR
ncbi:MAG: hypothetical protein DWQ36_16950 [Acidobacteria bacterium]|nr:MAG: hypothetical protein DWQ30_05045 [Acidobacteriota bacterium]REK04539.1 MAG: hypothetical protein DWQ36_16950 [Acidobacteriota bacterium]